MKNEQKEKIKYVTVFNGKEIVVSDGEYSKINENIDFKTIGINISEILNEQEREIKYNFIPKIANLKKKILIIQ